VVGFMSASNAVSYPMPLPVLPTSQCVLKYQVLPEIQLPFLVQAGEASGAFKSGL
jgi:hypothetical protein